MNTDSEARIQQRATRLWTDDGAPQGKDELYRERAIRQLKAEGELGTSQPASLEQSEKRRRAGDPLQERASMPPAEEQRDKRRG